MQLLFWLSVFLVCYVYAGYPLLIFLLSLVINRKINKSDTYPIISFIIAAYNEEKVIRKKIKNTLLLDYPCEKFEIMVVSDGSTDNTDAIVKEYENQGVSLFRVEGRVGKTESRNRAVAAAKGDIIVFSDADSDFNKNVLKAFVGNFSDPTVGMVSGKYLYSDPTVAPTGFMSILFWKYENFIKKCQSRIGTLTGASGTINAFRKELYTPLPAHIIEDLVEPLEILKKGYRVVFEPDALAFVPTTDDTSKEFTMRSRVIFGGMQGLWYVKELLNPILYPWVSFQLISHKIMRWSIPLLMTLLFLSNIPLIIKGRFYLIAFFIQVMFYVAAGIGALLARVGIRVKIFSAPLYFLLFNAASVFAFMRILHGHRQTTWDTLR